MTRIGPNCARCGHDWEDHVTWTLEDGCRCGSCHLAIPVPCRIGEDPEDNEGPRCECAGFVDEKEQTP